MSIERIIAYKLRESRKLKEVEETEPYVHEEETEEPEDLLDEESE